MRPDNMPRPFAPAHSEQTARAQVELPELPLPYDEPRIGYSADEMRVYARQAIAESEARAEGDKDAVDELLCRCIGLARKINNDEDGDDYLNASADLLRLIERARSPRTGIALFRAARWKDAAIQAQEAERDGR